MIYYLHLKTKKRKPLSRDICNLDIEEAVEKTLLYYKLFNSGISENLLHSFLLDCKVSRDELDDVVKSLLDKKTVGISDGIVYLNKKIESFYKPKPLINNVRPTKKLLRLLRRMPFISAIAFSGGTANYGLENHDDIDLFIITKPFTVYIVYFLIHVASLLLKSRKILCINYLVDETALQIRIQRDLFTANQIIALKPFKNESFLHYFLNNNNWIVGHYPNYSIPETNHTGSSGIYSAFRPLNYLIRLLYRFRYKQYLLRLEEGSVILSESIIKLHTTDYRSKIIREFHKQWNRYTSEKQKVPLTN